jgi:glutaredoxin
MKIEHVNGINKGKIMLYALSTCVWCKKTKKLLDDLGVEYNYIYVDFLKGDEKDEAIDKIMKCNPRSSFPTLLLDDKECIVGFNEKQIKEALRR